MKKMFVTVITFLSVVLLNAQTNLLPSGLIRAIDFVKKGDLRNYQLATNDTVEFSYFNVLLSQHNDQYDWNNEINRATDNTCKKLNDSVYEIEVKNLGKQIILVFADSRNGLEITTHELLNNFARLFPPAEAHIFADTVTKKKYFAMEYNPNIIDYCLSDSSGKWVRTFILKYVFPKPNLLLLSTKDSLIKEKLQSPSYAFSHPEIERYKLDPSSSFTKNKSLLFIFNHFLGNDRPERNDYLQYKTDNQTDWTSTALSFTPSILLENLSVGNHTLYVKYPAEDADVLEYHFAIAPN